MNKIENNEWETNLEEVIDFIKQASRGQIKWSWIRNSDCKYVDLRFDMRDGAFVILNRNKERILFEDLKFQVKV